jgi:putative transposase
LIVEFIDANKADHGVEPICDVLQFAPSTYYAFKTRPLSARALSDALMKGRAVAAVHRQPQRLRRQKAVDGSAACRP